MMNSPKPIAFVLALASTFACGIVDPTSEADRLNEARRKWVAAGIQSYEIDFKRSCGECIPESALSVRLTVENDAIVRVVNRTTSEELAEETHVFFLTVNDLFAQLAQVLQQKPFMFEADYDRTLGFPTFVSMDLGERVVDDELAYTLGNLGQRSN